MFEENKYWYLRNHFLFEQLTQQEVEELCIISNMKNAKKNDTIYFSQTEIKKVFIIKQGTVKICKIDVNGREIITEMLTEGDIFGYINNTETNKTEYAKVLTDEVKLCFFEASNFMNVLNKNQKLSIKFANIVNEKLISFQQKYEDLIFKDVDTRVVDFFRRYAVHHGKLQNNRIEMEMLLTHQDIADYTASSRQSVTTIINKMVESGKIIYIGRKKVIIENFDKF